jgi:site-specific DNA-methyltransferase (adenine-specific)
MVGMSESAELVHETSLGRLYRGDALPWLRSLDANSVDLVVADPPYGGNAVHWDKFKSLDDYAIWCEAWIDESHRVLKDGGSCFICGWSENLAYLKVLGDKYFARCRWLVWFYRNKQAAWRTDWGRAHESILHFRKGAKFTFNQDAVRTPYNRHTMNYPDHTQAATSVFGAQNGGKSGHVWQPHPLGAKPKDVLEISILNNGMKERTPHPTQKPEELIRRLVMACSDRGDLVIDPFVGSGTLAVVCEKLERRWEAVDLDADGEYLPSAIERLHASVPDEEANIRLYRQVASESTANRELVRTGEKPRDEIADIGADGLPARIALAGLEDADPESPSDNRRTSGGAYSEAAY